MLLAEITVAYSMRLKRTELTKVTTSAESYRCLLHFWPEATINLWEEAYVICLDRANRVIGYSKVGQGGISGCMIDPKVVFAIALKCAASSIVLAHNHPSGNLQPSTQDRALTEKFKNAAKLLDIGFLDHLIITPDGYFSFADDGML